jgi:hypothetical protein
MDPESENYPYMSPYCFAANSPIMLIDYEGESPLVPFAVIGFFVGGATEFVGQIMEGFVKGQGFKAALHQVDWADVLSAAVFTSIDVMTVGLSKLGTGSAHAAINAEFDLKFYNDKGLKLRKGQAKFTYGFGNKKHRKDNAEVFKDGVLGMIDVGIDLIAKIGDRVTEFLDGHMSCGEQKIVDGLVQTFKDKDYEYPITDHEGGLLLTIFDGFKGVHFDKLYDKIHDALPKHKPNFKKQIHRNNHGHHANAMKKASKVRYNPVAWLRKHH